MRRRRSVHFALLYFRRAVPNRIAIVYRCAKREEPLLPVGESSHDAHRRYDEVKGSEVGPVEVHLAAGHEQQEHVYLQGADAAAQRAD